MRHGEAVQVDPRKPQLKPPGSKHLKLKCDDLLLSFAFKFNLRRYAMYINSELPGLSLQYQGPGGGAAG